jgi:hypothetical protein
MTGFNALREHTRITWLEQEHGWAATPEDIVTVLSNEGFEECKREQTTSRPNRRPAGGLWQGVNPRTGSVASAIWVNRPACRTTSSSSRSMGSRSLAGRMGVAIHGLNPSLQEGRGRVWTNQDLPVDNALGSGEGHGGASPTRSRPRVPDAGRDTGVT